MDTVYIVTIDNGIGWELVVFADEDQAKQFSDIRGADMQSSEVYGEADAKRIIDEEAKERRDEERFERMREEGEI